jgi:hypothetical protein
MIARDVTRTPPGPGVDAAGAPVIDPTRNVRDLVDAANLRQDDLRKMEAEHIRELAALRAQCQKDEIEAVKAVEQLRADHAKELREAEAARIDAINAVNTLSVQQAAEVQDTRATTLATQVATSAETLRGQVQAAAEAAVTGLAAALEPIIKDIADLRRAQYEAQGTRAQATESGLSTRAWLGLALTATAIILSGSLAVTGIVITLLLR